MSKEYLGCDYKITELQRKQIRYVSCRLNCTICEQQIIPDVTHRFRARKSCILSSKLVRRESIVISSTKHVYLLTPTPFLPYLLPSIHAFSTSTQLFLSIPDDRAIVRKKAWLFTNYSMSALWI